LNTVAELADSISRLHRHAEEAGRDPSDIAIAYSASWTEEAELDERPGSERGLFSGRPAEVAEDVRTFEGLGVGHIKFDLRKSTLAESLERLERFAADVMPLV
jgi:alkanesulfonate monooxygenase SsuD/methylene tetrahydromethanopterin reductase-like flavin-dependent oxidoreductase (luciferase family)